MNAIDRGLRQVSDKVSGSSPLESLVLDRFQQNHPAGRVIGSVLDENRQRLGADTESVIAIDRGALRISPILKTAWGRSSLAYGPFERSNGLTFAVFMLNGHNTSQAEPIPDGLRPRLARWAKGTEAAPLGERLRVFLRARQRRYFWRRLLQWVRTGTRFHHVHALDQNLAIGWYPSVAPGDALQGGSAFVMFALGPECGDLRTRIGRDWLPTVRGLQNVPVYYVVVLREKGAAYYAATSQPGVPGLDALPVLRPLAIDARAEEPEVYAGIHQSVLGQIGFRVDSRVYQAQVARLTAFAQWYGSAVAADSLQGTDPVAASFAEIGGTWCNEGDPLVRASGGVSGSGVSAAWLSPGEPAGLIKLVVEADPACGGAVGLIWRRVDEHNYWLFEFACNESRLAVIVDGRRHDLPSSTEVRLAPNAPNLVQIADDGNALRLSINGGLAYGGLITDCRLAGGDGVGFLLHGGQGVRVRDFEAHPRTIPLPKELVLPAAWHPARYEAAIADDFASGSGELADRVTPVGGGRWEKTIGTGVFELADGRLRVSGSVARPSPGRTAYTVEWSEPAAADLSVTITPPGIERGHRERGRGGLIFWQDPGCYVTLSVFVDDWYGTSIAAFFQVDGFEELYDAVWTNVGRRIQWGVPYRFRVVLEDGRFLAYVDGEPVLERALSDIYPNWTDFKINKVGLVTNWEWGDDTGSAFQQFAAGHRR